MKGQREWRGLRGLSLVAVFLLVVTACGGGDDNGTEPDASNDTDPAAADDDGGDDSGDESDDSGDGSEDSGDGEESDALAELIEAAEAEGQVVLYSSEAEEVNHRVIAAFEEEYDITVELLRLGSGPLTTRYHEEREAGISAADVVRSADGELIANPDYFLEIDADLVPILSEYPEEAWTSPTSVSSQWSLFGAAYNTDAISEPPETWLDLLDDRFDGQIALTDFRRGARSWWVWMEAMVDAHGLEYLEELGNMNWDFVDSSTTGAQFVASGSHPIAFPHFEAHSAPVMEQGAPVDFVVLRDPMPLKADHWGLATDPPNPNAARLFLHYRLSEPGLAISCDLSQLIVPLDGIDGCFERTEEMGRVYPDIYTDEDVQPYFDALGVDRS